MNIEQMGKIELQERMDAVRRTFSDLERKMMKIDLSDEVIAALIQLRCLLGLQ